MTQWRMPPSWPVGATTGLPPVMSMVTAWRLGPPKNRILPGWYMTAVACTPRFAGPSRPTTCSESSCSLM